MDAGINVECADMNDSSNSASQVSERLNENSTSTESVGRESEENGVGKIKLEPETAETNNGASNSSEPFKTPELLDLRTIKCPLKKETGEIKIKVEPPDTSVAMSDGDSGCDVKIEIPDGSTCDSTPTEPVSGRSSKSSKSPAEKLHDKTIPLPYKEPAWSGVTDKAYSFEVLKSGVIVDQISLNTKSFYVVGRLSTCDVIMEHPSISRYHAIIQHRSTGDNVNQAGFYLYDLDSTHGTFLNKQPVKPRCYHRLRVGHMVKFGGSTRMFILQGPEEDQEDESELTVTELIELRKKQEELLDRLEKGENEEEAKEGGGGKTDTDEDSGIDWGMGEDAVEDEEDNLADNPFALDAIAPNEDLYIDDPKKTLRGWFEREGYELEYNVEEKGYSQFLCRVQLPLDSPSGEPLVAEASVKGKKKEAVVACALEACRMLDRQGLLRQANHESRKRKQKNWEDEDYYDSDEDTFLDRTGTIEKKRQQRIQKAGKEAPAAETFESLTAKYEELMTEINHIEDAIQKSANSDSRNIQLDDIDDLDAYMTSIKNEAALDKSSRTALKVKLSQLRQEEEKLQRLINIAKPTSLPELKRTSSTNTSLRPHAPTKLKSDNVKEVFSVPDSIKRPGMGKPKLQIGPVLKLDVKLPPEAPEVNALQTSTPDMAKDPVEPLQNASTEPTSARSSSPPLEKTSIKPSLPEKIEPSSRPTAPLPFQVAHTVSKRISGADEQKKIPKKARKDDNVKHEYDSTDPDYAVWLPPEGQTGDGRTSLNDKFGY